MVKNLPNYATRGSAAVDLYACIDKSVVIKPFECVLVGTGIALNMQDVSIASILIPRSGLGHKKGLILGNTVGLIDSDYQGEIMVSCFNRSQDDIIITPNMRFAQMMFIPVLQPQFEVVEDFAKKTMRGTGCFGHTGY